MKEIGMPPEWPFDLLKEHLNDGPSVQDKIIVRRGPDSIEIFVKERHTGRARSWKICTGKENPNDVVQHFSDAAYEAVRYALWIWREDEPQKS